jgi:hypothetical protein
MTPEAVATTLAMTIGQKLYNLHRGQAYQKYIDGGGSAGDAGAFGLKFQQQVSPLVLALPYMPKAARAKMITYIQSLPASAQLSIGNQIGYANEQGWLNGK